MHINRRVGFWSTVIAKRGLECVVAAAWGAWNTCRYAVSYQMNRHRPIFPLGVTCHRLRSLLISCPWESGSSTTSRLDAGKELVKCDIPKSYTAISTYPPGPRSSWLAALYGRSMSKDAEPGGSSPNNMLLILDEG